MTELERLEKAVVDTYVGSYADAYYDDLVAWAKARTELEEYLEVQDYEPAI